MEKKRGQRKFYISVLENGKAKWKEVYAYPLKYEGIDFFIQKTENNTVWAISHAKSGLRFCNSETKKDALLKIKEVFLSRGLTSKMLDDAAKKVEERIGRKNPLFEEV